MSDRVGPTAGPGVSKVGGNVADGSPTPGTSTSAVASGDGRVLPGEAGVVPGVAVAPGAVGDGVAVETGCVGMGDGVSVAGAGVADETGSDVGVRDTEGGSVTLVGGGVDGVADGVAEGVTGTGVGVMVGIVWFREAPPSASPAGDQASSRSTSTTRMANAKGRRLIDLSFTLHLSIAGAG